MSNESIQDDTKEADRVVIEIVALAMRNQRANFTPHRLATHPADKSIGCCTASAVRKPFQSVEIESN